MGRNKIKRRAIIGCILFTMLVSAVIGIVGYVEYSRSINEKYRRYAETIVDIADDAFTRYGMVELIEARSMEGEYENVRLVLNSLKQNADVAYIFAVTFNDPTDPDSMCYITNGARYDELAEAEDEREVYSYMGEPCGEGDFDRAMRELYLECYNSTDTGIHFYENVTDEYGHMLTAFKPVIGSNGKTVGLINVDTDISAIQDYMKDYVIKILAITLGFALFFGLLSTYVLSRFLVSPVTRIADSTNEFVVLMEKKVQPEELVFNDPKVSKNDELGMLSGDVMHMAQSVKTYMLTLQKEMKEKERIGAELELATRIQANMLPNIFPAFPERKDFDIFASMTPAKEVGGDFYDFMLLDDDHLAVVIADVSGKGVPAALFMMMSMILINNTTRMEGAEASPAAVLTQVNNTICANNEEEMFVTVWLGIINLKTGIVKAANAGHEYPIIKKADGGFELLKDKHGMVVGAMEGIRYREYEFTLEKGGALFLYTDGVAEATNAKDELFGTDRTLASLNEVPDAAPREILAHVKQSIDKFVGDAPQFDDLTMVAVKLT